MQTATYFAAAWFAPTEEAGSSGAKTSHIEDGQMSLTRRSPNPIIAAFTVRPQVDLVAN